MFASYEVATSFPSLTAIKGYDLDKSSDVPLMGHYIRNRISSNVLKFDRSFSINDRHFPIRKRSDKI